MSYRLGVDLGTTFTSAAISRDGHANMVHLGTHAMQVPSVLFLRPNGTFEVGESAERLAGTDPDRAAREFKRRLGDSVPILVAGTPHSPQALQARLLSWVVDEVSQREKEPPAAITLTRPANWGPFKLDLFAETVRLADLDNVTICTEPEAAATWYAVRERLPEGAAVAVYDLGGGTFDAAVVRRTSAGLEILGEPDGIEHLGGIDFDHAVFHHVLSILDDEPASLNEGPDLTAALARLRRDCVEAKEALSSDTETQIPVDLPGLTTTVRMMRAEFEGLIRPAIQQTVDMLGRVIHSAGLAPSDVTAIILTGGSSRIPLVSEMLGTAFRRPLVLGTHPKHDIALGAASYGDPLAPAAPQESTPAFPVSNRVVEPSPDVPTRAGPSAVDHRSSRRVLLVAAVIVLVLAASVGTVLAILSNRGAEPDATHPSTTPTTPLTTTPTTTKTTTTTTTTPPGGFLALGVPKSALLITKSNGHSVSMLAVDLSDPDAVPVRIGLPQLPTGDKAVLPTIAPDRKSFAYLVGKKPFKTFDELRVQSVVGDQQSAPSAETVSVGDSCQINGRPAYSPDGRQLAVPCVDGTLSLVDLTSHQTRSILPAGTVAGNPTWSTSNLIIFPRMEGQHANLWSVDPADPTALQPVTVDTTGLDSHPDWSNATGRLLYMRHTGTKDDPVNVAFQGEASSGVFTEIPHTVNIQAPSWSPDASHIAFLLASNKGHLTLCTMAIGDPNGTVTRIGIGHGVPGPPAWDSR